MLPTPMELQNDREIHSTLLLLENEKPEMESNLCQASEKIVLKLRVPACDSKVRLAPNYALHVSSNGDVAKCCGLGHWK